ncbi:MAG TPA: sugar ABC transporter ATP-binding protein [Gemmatimonadaceae bacterium]|jgi:ABC-type sugar transport system ATPase subunit|nr:sugar ABC transporter ATP-binding protein [Gemmatimonadaceae bacterium]
MNEPAVQFEQITKRFLGVQALDGVSLEVAAGSCHALCGENGAGKSTLGKILAGIHSPDAGRLLVRGREVRFDSPREASAAGVGMVHQELAFCGNMTVAENLLLGNLPRRGGFVDRASLERQARDMLAEIGAELDVRAPMSELRIAQQQLVQIATAVCGAGADIVIFDEPTSSLSQADADRLYELIERLKARGVTCIYVSHRMPEIYRLCDTISVLRDGRHVATRPTATLSESELVTLMIGRELGEYLPQSEERRIGKELLRVERLTVPGKFRDVSFSLHEGEIIGLAGLVGAGRSEIAQAIFGLEGLDSGKVFVDGREAHIEDPKDAIALGIGLVPEDRKKQGLVLGESGLHNTTLPILERLSRAFFVRREEEQALASSFFSTLRVRTPSLSAPVAGLSGGNQQKVVLARWLAANSRILILDEPTRGVDVGAKAEIHRLIRDLAARGNAVLLISSELPEVIAISHRVLVMRQGRIVTEVPHEQATQELLLRLMAGVELAPAA